MKSTLVIHVQFGLTNRLRALASAYVFAQSSNRKLHVIWEADTHCNCHFEDLFDNRNLNIHSSLDIALENFTVYNCMEAKGYDPIPFVEHRTKQDIYVKTYNPINSSLSDLTIENAFLKQLTPNKTVQLLIDSLTEKHTYGVHIRRQGSKDGVSWEKKENNWTSEAQQELNFARDMANESFFKSEIKGILLQHPKSVFYVAADKISCIRSLIPELENSIIWLPRTLEDRSKESVQYALADLILLSKSKALLGSYFSSFSEMAARIGSIKVRLSGFDFGKASDLIHPIDHSTNQSNLNSIDTLIERLRTQRGEEYTNYSGEIKLGSNHQLGPGIGGMMGWAIRRFSNFLVRRQIYFFTRKIKKLGNYMIKIGNDLIDIDRF